MKYSAMTRDWFGLLCLLFICMAAHAQNEKVIFNLDEGKFDNAKIPYVHPIVIAGVPVKNKESVDAITLVVTKVTSDDEQKLLAKREQVRDLQAQVDADKGPLDYLKKLKENINKDIKVTDISKELKEKKLTTLAEKFSSTTVAAGGLQPAQIAELNKAVSDEITRLESLYNEKNSNLIRLKDEIIKLEKVVGAGPFFQGTWVRASEGDDEFTFAMPDKLKMAEKYMFAFTIYKKNKVVVPIDELLNPLVAEFNQALKTSGYYLSDSIRSRVTATIKTIEDGFFANVFNIDATTKTITPKKGFGLPPETITKLTALIEDFYQQQSDIKTDSELLASNTVLLMNAINSRNIPVQEHDEIIRLTELPGKTADLKTALNGAGYTSKEGDTIVQLYEAIRQNIDSIASNRIQATNSRTEIQKIFDNIKSLYTSMGTTTSTATTGETDIDGIKVSTTYGIGMVVLDKNTIEWFRFFAVNFRLDGFDNRLPGKEAYHSYWSRISLMVGISNTSDMQYKGNKLENTRLGIKPVIGVNWEPIKHVNVGVGMISFIQQSASDSQKDPKIRGYVSLSFDFNLFNYLIQNQ